MGNNIDKSTSKNTHNNIMHTPLYSSGTPEMEGKAIMGSPEAPEKPPAVNTSYATQLGPK